MAERLSLSLWEQDQAHTAILHAWRALMQRSNDVLLRDIPTFRRAVRYGLVTLHSEPIVFYFEKVGALQEVRQ